MQGHIHPFFLFSIPLSFWSVQITTHIAKKNRCMLHEGLLRFKSSRSLLLKNGILSLKSPNSSILASNTTSVDSRFRSTAEILNRTTEKIDRILVKFVMPRHFPSVPVFKGHLFLTPSLCFLPPPSVSYPLPLFFTQSNVFAPPFSLSPLPS